MPRLDDYPFHSLRHFKDRYFEAAQTASANSYIHWDLVVSNHGKMSTRTVLNTIQL